MPLHADLPPDWPNNPFTRLRWASLQRKAAKNLARHRRTNGDAAWTVGRIAARIGGPA